MKRIRHAVPVLMLLLSPALTGCWGDDDRGAAVYGKPLAEQLKAAVAETRAAGSARFTATVEYNAPTSTARHVTTGTLDFAHGTSRAELTREIPSDFPVDAAPRLDRNGAAYPLTLATAGTDVYARGDDGVWLHWPQAARKALDPKGEAPVSAHAPGRVLPFGGTLAELVAAAVPRQEPLRREGGAREYAATVPLGRAQDLLPSRIGPKTDSKAYVDEQLPLTVVLDAHGRLLSADVDLVTLLEQVNGSRHQSMQGMPGVTGLHATLTLSEHGEPAGIRTPDRARTADARRSAADVKTRPRGTCAVPTAGLADAARVRVVGCDRPHTMRVFKTTGTSDAGRITPARYLADTCDAPYRRLPAAWKRGAQEPYGHLVAIRSSSFRMRFDSSGKVTGPEPKLAMDVVCYVRTPATGTR
ncbi:hypothetical protein LG634_17285 [Streptomyces bambusae]|uniref:hypothetical protein n=1 Tax=Streptomyces bambusae TaxID=1550616 RepID=UPI001CFEB311|nr:hypothetical protein [Streptomyces bambusae]MCB5166584.1 hypothetical protein [Streptomyces bambusae]